MKIFNLKTTYLLLFIFSLCILITFSSVNYTSVKNTTELFLTCIFPSLFPFILFTEITLKTNVINELSKTLSFIPKVFKLSDKCCFPIILGYICGFPSGARVTNTLYSNKEITKRDALTLLSFVNNFNPIFILTTIGFVMFNNTSIGIILLISHFLGSAILGIIYSRINSYNIIHDKTSNLNSNKENICINTQKDIDKFEILKKSITNTFQTLLFIFSFILIFNIFTDIITSNISNVYLKDILSGIFEITRGTHNISNYTNYYISILLVAFLLGFSGICIIFEIKCFVKNINISFRKIILFKFCHGIISVIIAYILLKYTNILNMSDLSVFSNIENEMYYRNKMYTSYIHSIALILFILSTYFFLLNERGYIKK